MNTYEVKIFTYNGRTVDDFQKQIEQTKPHICVGLNEVWDLCGGKLHRERNGYASCVGNTYYIATRIN